MTDTNRISITGMGCCCSAGNNSLSVWDSIDSNKVNCLQTAADFFHPHKSSPLFKVSSDNLVESCYPFFKEKLKSSFFNNINRTTSLALVAIGEALNQAQIDLNNLSTLRVGVVLGTTVGCTFDNESYYLNWQKGEAQDYSAFLSYLSANLSERIQALLQIKGPRAVVTNACASGTDAIGIAKQWLQNDMCDLAIAGGADEISRIACHGFSSLMLFSPNPCKPFDKDRQGLNLGEGAGILIMERENSAERRKAKTIGLVQGYGAASDAYHPTAPHPEGRGLQMAIQIALKDAGITMDQLCYVNAHGTGTQANDHAELTALAKLISPSDYSLPIVSTKGSTGHTLGAAGAIEAVLTIMSLQKGLTSGTTGCQEQDPRFPIKILAENKRISLMGSLGMSQSLAFGGGNSALILEAIG